MVWDSDLLEKARSRRDPWHRIHFRTARLDLRRQPVGNEGCPRRLLAQLSGRSDVSGKGEEPMGKRESYEPGTFCWVDLTTTNAEGAKAFYGDLLAGSSWTTRSLAASTRCATVT